MDVWEEHDRLYHYTTQAGLKGILESQMLHATHFRYMNDPLEMHHMIPRLKTLVEPHARKAYSGFAADEKIRAKIDAGGGLEKLVEHDVTRAVESLHRVTFGSDGRLQFFNPYIISFCGHKETYERENGLLSQWRAYGQDAGYAIAFDTKRLVDIVKAEADFHFFDSGHFGDVVYEGDEEGFTREFAELIDVIGKVFPLLFARKAPPLDTLYSSFIGSVSRFKQRGFREEHEVRIILSPMSHGAIDRFKKENPEQYAKSKHKAKKDIYFRETLAPYIRLFDKIRVTLPIVKVIVGPHAEKETRQQRLSRYLELQGMEIDVSCSRTPLTHYR